jgi:peptidoglycan/LPS O-acetylase OafA/YrhL
MSIITQTAPVSAQTDANHPPHRTHITWLDSLRALAALYVMMSHIVVTVWPQINNFRGMTLVAAGPFRYGHFAVGLFIVLSGFSLMLPVARGKGELKGGSWHFFGRRAKRILPTYYSALGLSLLLIHYFIGKKTGTHWDVSLPVTSIGIWSHLLMLQDIFSGPQINHALWSISVEWRIYFLFPLLVLSFKQWGDLKTSLGMLIISVFMLALLQHTILIGITPAYYALFTFGMLSCQVCYGHSQRLCILRDHLPWGVIASLLALVFMILLYKWRLDHSAVCLYVMDILNGMLASVILIWFGKPDANYMREWLSWKPLAFVGTFAYSVYLIHAPLIQIVWQFGIRPFHKEPLVSYIFMVFVGIPLIIGTSYVFFLAFERPFLNTKKHETMAETARDAALEPAP